MTFVGDSFAVRNSSTFTLVNSIILKMTNKFKNTIKIQA